MNQEHSPFSRRVGSAARGKGRPKGGRIWGLRALPVVFTLPTLVALGTGQPVKLLALLAGIGLCTIAAVLVRRGLDATVDYEDRRFAKPPPPFRTAGALALGAAFFVVGAFATGYGFVMSLVFAALGIGAALATYGTDPTTTKAPDSNRITKAGVRVEQVMAAIAEAEGKIKDIADAAATLRNRELRGRIDRIVDRAHAVLDELERDPKDLSRARRFLNTYLDGTRNVIRDYARRQDDFDETPLSANFQSVLGTIEQVFHDQTEHLRKNEALDLEVAIEVLNTQLTREGVG